MGHRSTVSAGFMGEEGGDTAWEWSCEEERQRKRGCEERCEPAFATAQDAVNREMGSSITLSAAAKKKRKGIPLAEAKSNKPTFESYVLQHLIHLVLLHW